MAYWLKAKESGYLPQKEPSWSQIYTLLYYSEFHVVLTLTEVLKSLGIRSALLKQSKLTAWIC